MKSILMATILGLASLNANAALILTPGDADFTTTDNTNLNAAEIAALAGYTGDVLSLIYKDNVGGSEEGSLAAVYETVFSNTATDPMDFLINYISGTPADCPECFLIVKDGNQDPAQYLFDLGSWNGTEQIVGTGFWPAQGAISNVAVWNYSTGGGGGGGDPIPEPLPLAMIGIGLVGLGAYTRRKRYTLS
jgi:hypothetical protein